MFTSILISLRHLSLLTTILQDYISGIVLDKIVFFPDRLCHTSPGGVNTIVAFYPPLMYSHNCLTFKLRLLLSLRGRIEAPYYVLEN